MSARRTRGRDDAPTLFGPIATGAARTSTARIVAGIDEAGLGPMLGPLSIGMSAFRIPAAESDRPKLDLWAALAPAVARDIERDGERLVVADSKVVFTRTPSGARRLERTVLAFEALLARRDGACAGTRAFLEATPSILRAAGLEHEAWYERLPARLSTECAGDALDAAIRDLRSASAAAAVELVMLAVRAVSARELNASFALTESKGTTHWQACAPFMIALWSRHGHEGVELVVDRHGGRMRYAALLRSTIEGAEVAVVRELPAVSEYVLRGDGGRVMRIVFMEQAENASFAVALASCAAKYAREACMEAFNAYFGALQDGLAPTAGYVTDARRWLADATVAIDRSGLARDAIVRSR